MIKNEAVLETQIKKSLLLESKLLMEESPSKDTRFFARSVYRFLTEQTDVNSDWHKWIDKAPIERAILDVQEELEEWSEDIKLLQSHRKMMESAIKRLLKGE